METDLSRYDIQKIDVMNCPVGRSLDFPYWIADRIPGSSGSKAMPGC